MTQELVASMLGVRREGITEAAGKSAACRLHPLPPRPHCGARARRTGDRARASATPWSRRNCAACCPTCGIARAFPIVGEQCRPAGHFLEFTGPHTHPVTTRCHLPRSGRLLGRLRCGQVAALAFPSLQVLRALLLLGMVKRGASTHCESGADRRSSDQHKRYYPTSVHHHGFLRDSTARSIFAARSQVGALTHRACQDPRPLSPLGSQTVRRAGGSLEILPALTGRPQSVRVDGVVGAALSHPACVTEQTISSLAVTILITREHYENLQSRIPASR